MTNSSLLLFPIIDIYFIFVPQSNIFIVLTIANLKANLSVAMKYQGMKEYVQTTENVPATQGTVVPGDVDARMYIGRWSSMNT